MVSRAGIECVLQENGCNVMREIQILKLKLALINVKLKFNVHN